jgi:thiamine transporter ThiT
VHHGARHPQPITEARPRGRVAGPAIIASTMVLALAGHVYSQLPHLLFVEVLLAAVWLGIASLFSP